MNLWCVQSGRHRLRKLAGAALSALLIAAIFGCGRTAPEGFWEPTSDDTAGIKAAVEANKGLFRTGLAELAMQMCDTALPGTTRTILTKELTGNPYKSRFRLNQLQHVLDTVALKYTFIAGLDTLDQETTCTVTMAETIPGRLVIHAWQKTDSVAVDTIKVSENEYRYLTRYSTTMDSCDTIIEKPLNGSTIEGCVLKKVGGVWQLWKMAGGGRFFAPGLEDAPPIGSFALKSANDRLDSVFLRPDTAHYGIQRFYSLDSQTLTYAVGDWVTATIPYAYQNNGYDYLYFNGKRYEITDTVKFDSVSPGIHRLSLEHIPVAVLWEVDGYYNATVWGIPIRIK